MVLNVADNVATLLDDNLDLDCLENETFIELGIPFGHKVSLSFSRRRTNRKIWCGNWNCHKID